MHEHRAVAAASAAVTVVSLNVIAATTAAPELGRDLGLSIETTQWVVNATTVACAALVIPAGRLGDRIGSRTVLLGGLLLFAVGCVIVALGADAPAVIAGRALQGIGGAAVVPSSLAIAGTSVPAARRPAAVGVWSASVGASFSLGPLVGGLAGPWGWAAVWWIELPVAAVAFGLVLAWIPRRPPARPELGVDPVGTALLAAAIVAAITALVQADVWGWAATAGVAATALACAAGCVAVERGRPDPVVSGQLLRRRRFAGGALGTLIVKWINLGTFFTLSVYLQAPTGGARTVGEAALWQLCVSVPLFVLSLVAGRVTARYGAGRPIGAGLALVAVGAVAVLVAGASAETAVLLPAFALIGAGIGLANAPCSTVAISAAPAGHTGEASGALNLALYLGSAIGIATTAALGATPDAILRGWAVVAAALAVLGGAAVLALIATRGPRPSATHVAVAPGTVVHAAGGVDEAVT